MKIVRTHCEVTVQNKNGIYVDSTRKDSILDIIKLRELGYYAYGIRANTSGNLGTLEDGFVHIDQCGYMVFSEPINFPRRKRKEYRDYYTLNNRYSSISHKYVFEDILKKLHYYPRKSPTRYTLTDKIRYYLLHDIEYTAILMKDGKPVGSSKCDICMASKPSVFIQVKLLDGNIVAHSNFDSVIITEKITGEEVIRMNYDINHFIKTVDKVYNMYLSFNDKL